MSLVTASLPRLSDARAATRSRFPLPSSSFCCGTEPPESDTQTCVSVRMGSVSCSTLPGYPSSSPPQSSLCVVLIPRAAKQSSAARRSVPQPGPHLPPPPPLQKASLSPSRFRIVLVLVQRMLRGNDRPWERNERKRSVVAKQFGTFLEPSAAGAIALLGCVQTLPCLLWGLLVLLVLPGTSWQAEEEAHWREREREQTFSQTV